MGYIPKTAFKAAFDSKAFEALKRAKQAPSPREPISKWDILRDLGIARRKLDLSDRAIGVLQAILSFHPDKYLGQNMEDLIVFPSNAAICERLNGMPCSTMRRHLSALLQAGIIARRDSPNGKRFSRRRHGSSEVYGFDLTPLLHRAQEFKEISEATRAEDEALSSLRRQVSLMRRDLASIVAFGRTKASSAMNWDQAEDFTVLAAQKLRRKLGLAELKALKHSLQNMLAEVSEELKLSTSNDENEQHQQITNKEDLDKDPESTQPVHEPETLPLSYILEACPGALEMVGQFRPWKGWRYFVDAGSHLAPMLGISSSVWHKACSVLGPVQTAMVVFAMTEKVASIHNPGGYFQALLSRAEVDKFDANGMIIGLMNQRVHSCELSGGGHAH